MSAKIQHPVRFNLYELNYGWPVVILLKSNFTPKDTPDSVFEMMTARSDAEEPRVESYESLND